MVSLELTEKEKVEMEIFTELALIRLKEKGFTPGERIDALLSGKILDRIPFQIIDNTSRLIGKNIQDFFFDPISRYKSLCAQIYRWGVPMTETASRINSYKIGEALGAELKYSYNEAPSTLGYIIKEPEDFEKLTIPNINKYIEKDIWLIKMIKHNFGEILGSPCTFLYAPFSWAATYLREPSKLLMETYDNPSFVHRLCRFATDLELKISKALAEQSGCAFFMPDGFCELLSPEQYQEFALPYTAELINALPENLFYIPVPSNFTQIISLYDFVKDHKKLICMGSSIGPNNPIRSFKELQEFRKIMNSLNRPFQIAIDQTTMKISSPNEIIKTVKELLDFKNKKNVMFRTDTLDPATPEHNIDALVWVVEKYGVY